MDFKGDMNIVTPNQEQASTQEELQPLPQRYRFVPTDKALITDFLKKKINNEPVPYICTVNVYKYNPQELTETRPNLEENEWYFFSPRTRKYPHGNRPNRAADTGYWKASSSVKQIYHDEVCIGSKRSLVFYEGKFPNGKKTDWIMHECMDYQPSRLQNDNDPMLLDKCVLCQIHLNPHLFAKSKNGPSASVSCQIGQQETEKSFRNENQASYKRAKSEYQGQYYLPGHPNLPMQQPNCQVQQQNLSALADNHYLGGWFDCCSGSTSEVAEQILSDNLNLKNDPESYFDLISNDVINILPHQNIYDLTHCNSPMDCSGSELSLVNDMNHQQEGCLLERNLDKWI